MDANGIIIKVYNMMMILYTKNSGVITTVKLINKLIVPVITGRGRVRTGNEHNFVHYWSSDGIYSN